MELGPRRGFPEGNGAIALLLRRRVASGNMASRAGTANVGVVENYG